MEKHAAWSARAGSLWRHRFGAVDVLLALVCAVTAMGPAMDSTLFAGSPYTEHQRPATWIVVAAAVLIGGAALTRRRRPLLLVVAALLGWVVAAAYPAVILGQYSLGAGRGSRRVLGVVTVVVVIAVGIPFVEQGLDSIVPLSVAVVLAPTLLGLWNRSRRDLVESLRERAERAECEQRLVADQARAEERARIAHDMHDVVAHRVSLMVLHATALEVAAEADRVPLARRIRLIGREALDELRTLVGVLRTDDGVPLRPQPTIADIEELVKMSAGAGTAVTVEATGSARTLPAIIEQTGYRVVQEALTNVHKHAGSTHAAVRLQYDPDRLTITVTNGAPGRPERTADPLPTGGHGLNGLRERVHLVGGWLTARPTFDGGFTVDAVIPIPAADRA